MPIAIARLLLYVPFARMFKIAPVHTASERPFPQVFADPGKHPQNIFEDVA